MAVGWTAMAEDLRYGPVSSQDTLFKIAAQFYPQSRGLSSDEFRAAIVAANPDSFVDGDPDRLILGSTLRIPLAVAQNQAGERTSSGTVGARRHGPVKPGEGVYAIAARYRDRAGDLNLRQWSYAILAANPDAFGGNLGALRAGAMLDIPDEAGVRRLWREGERLAVGGSDDSGDADVAVAQAGGDAPPPAEAPAAPDESSSPAPGTTDTGTETAAAGGAALAADEGPAGPFRETALHARALAALEAGAPGSVRADLTAAEPQYGGDPDFDYLYGVALLDHGAPELALFPLLRASNSRPGSLGVRLDLGRAYFEAGENESARLIFDELAAQDPPPRAAAVIDSYRQAIRVRASRYENRTLGSVGARSGFDSNANSATDSLEFAGFTLDDNSRSTESPYFELDGNVEHSRPLTARVNALLRARGGARQFTDASQFSTTQYTLGAGLGYRQGNWRLRGELSGGQLFVDGEDNNTSVAATAAWDYQSNPVWQYRSSLKYNRLRFADEVSIRDVNQWLLAFGGSRRLALGSGAQLSADLLLGTDDAVESGSPNGRDVAGIAVGGLFQIDPRWQAFATSTLLRSDYDGPFVGDDGGESDREDVQWGTEIGVNLQDNRFRDWVLRGAIGYVQNDSDIDLFEYDRFDVRIGIRRFFN